MTNFAVMASFLSRVAQSLYQMYGPQLNQCCLVFPGRRVQLFFDRALQEILASGKEDSPIWRPHSLSMTSLVREWTGKETSSDLLLLAQLYHCFCQLTRTSQPFDTFYSLGIKILRDFDTLDKYRVDAQQIYRNIRDLKAIPNNYSFLSPEQIACITQFWSSFQANPQHTLNQQFITLWEILPTLYEQFQATLRSRGMAYEGMLFKEAVAQLTRGELEAWCTPYAKVVFIGFNALNECEKQIFSHLQEQQRALFYWDYDPYYIKDTNQEAGLFMRENLKRFPSPLPYRPEESPLSGPKDMEVLAVSSNVLQAKMVPQLLKDRAMVPDIRTAVVLANENLLLPLLYAIAPQEEPTQKPSHSPINVTMGFPLAQTALYSLIDTLVRLYVSALQPARKNVHGLYYKDVLPLVHHPLIKRLGGQALEQAQKTWIAQNVTHFLPSHAAHIPLLAQLLDVPTTAEAFHRRLTGVLDAIDACEDLGPHGLVIRYAARKTRQQLNQLLQAMAQLPGNPGQRSPGQSSPAGPPLLSVPMAAQLLLMHLKQETLPFSGEPLEGIQIMGMLETRCLDFENVILLSAQENCLPKEPIDNSLIPFNLKRAFGLPGTTEQVAMQAYYFYRLIQRAKKVTFVYNNKVNGLFRGEISRFLRQLEVEHPPLTYRTLQYRLSLPERLPLTVPKPVPLPTQVSPSALKTYMACPLQYYFRYVALLKEPQSITDEVDGAGLGTVVHKSLEIIYRPLIGATVTREQLKAHFPSQAALRTLVEEQIALYYTHTAKNAAARVAQQGKWVVLSMIAGRYITRFLEFDLKRAPYTLLDLEAPFEFQWTSPGLPQSVTIKGIVDRIEAKDGHVFISDYKTGSGGLKVTLDQLFGKDPQKQEPNIFQVLCYSYLDSLQHPQKPVCIPQLYYLRQLGAAEDPSAGLLTLNKTRLTQPELFKDEFITRFTALLEEMYNFEVPYTQTPYASMCTYCDYKSICQREENA